MTIALLELMVNLWTFGAPLVVVVWAVLRLLAHAPARVRYVVAIAGLLASLLLPVAVSLMGRNPLRAAGAARVVMSEAPVLAPAVATPAAGPLAMIWAAVALLLLARDAVGHLRLRRTRRGLEDAPDALKQILSWPRRVPLVVSAHPAPFTVGLIKPAVVLPSDLGERFPADVVKRIALHELSHARWRDPLIYALLRVVAAAFWAAPVWLPLRWVRREREAAADESALRGASGEEESYVAALLRLSRMSSGRRLAPGVAASDLEYRARRILAPQRASVLAVLVLFAGALLVAVATPAQVGAEVAARSGSAAVPAAGVAASRAATRVGGGTPPGQPAGRRRTVKTETPAADVEVEVQPLPIARDLGSLRIPETVEQRVEDHVDVHVDVHVDDDDEPPRVVERVVDDDDRRVYRIVLRDKKKK